MEGSIYKIYNDINNKLYIGKTVSSLEERFNQHVKDSKRRRYEKRPLYNAMNKYGIDHFYIELVEKCDIEELSIKENYWIRYYDTYNNGYNATLGGDGTILYDYNLITQLFNTGLTAKEITEQINCDAKVVRNALNRAGINTTENLIARLSKKVEMYDKDTEELLLTFPSQIEAGRWLQNNNKTTEKRVESISARIGQVCKGKRKTAYGYKWKNL